MNALTTALRTQLRDMSAAQCVALGHALEGEIHVEAEHRVEVGPEPVQRVVVARLCVRAKA